MALMFSLSGESGSEGGEKQASGGRFGEAMWLPESHSNGGPSMI